MKKLWICLAAPSLLAACASSQNTEVNTAVQSNYPTVKVLSWSDFHSNIYEAKKDENTALGGLPVFMAAVEKLRGSGLSLLVDGGDMFQGAMPFNESKGMGMIEVMNALQIDVATIGNHEFDYGPGVRYAAKARGAMYEALEASTFPWVSANIAKTADSEESWPPLNLAPYVILEKGPYRIAVIGLASTETPIATKAENVAGIEFRNAAETLRDIMPEVVSKNPDFVIVDAHLSGLPVPLPEQAATVQNAAFDSEIGEILALPDDVLKDIDLILSAHSHKSFIAHQGDLTVIQTLSAGREITEMALVGDDKGLHLDRDSIKKHLLKHEPIDAECGQTPKPLAEMAAGDLTLVPSEKGREIVTKYEGLMTQNRCEIMGCADELIKRNYTAECALGDLVTDAMRAYYPQADAAIQNAGGLRIDVPQGSLYRETLNALMPFDNYAFLIEIPGADLARILKVSSSLAHGAMQVSGISYTIEAECSNPQDLTADGKTEDWENNCLCNAIFINGEPMQDDKMYKVVISDFLYNGGDALGGMFDRAKLIEKGPVIKDTIYTYVKSLNACISVNSLIKADKPRIINATCNGKYYP